MTRKLAAGAAALALVVPAGAGAATCRPQVLDYGLPSGGRESSVLTFGPHDLAGGGVVDSAGVRHPALWHGTRLEILPYDNGNVLDINRSGVVLFNADVDFSAFTSRAFVLRPGNAPLELAGLGGAFINARRINDRGEIAGSATDASGVEHAVVWRHHRPVDLGVPAGYDGAYAKGINRRGDLVGSAYGADKATPWIWRADGTSGPLDAGPFDNASGEVNVIDDAGRAAGISGPLDAPTGEATIWVDGVRHGLGNFPGGDSSDIFGTDDKGDFVGIGGRFPGDQDGQVLLTRGTGRLYTMPALDGRIGDISSAHAVTWRKATGVTVGGTSQAPDGNLHATVWTCAYKQAVRG